MGLAAARTKQKFGLDPRNTNWFRDTERFGHRHLVNMGWEPGHGLGKVSNSITSHIRVKIKRDNMGLGADLGRNKSVNGNEINADGNTYLDNFQKLLGRLNGHEDEINDAVEKKRQDRIISGRWGIDFVKGETVSSTWDKEQKKMIQKETESARKRKSSAKETSCKRRKISKVEGMDEDEQRLHRHKHYHHKSKKTRLDGKVSQKKHHKHSHSVEKEKKKSQGDKHENHHHHHHHHHHHSSSKDNDKGDSSSKKRKDPTTSDSDTGEAQQMGTVLQSKMALRSKWIKQKRAAVMDKKALQEIFMVR